MSPPFYYALFLTYLYYTTDSIFEYNQLCSCQQFSKSGHVNRSGAAQSWSNHSAISYHSRHCFSKTNNLCTHADILSRILSILHVFSVLHKEGPIVGEPGF